jgi:hypothetical protein
MMTRYLHCIPVEGKHSLKPCPKSLQFSKVCLLECQGKYLCLVDDRAYRQMMWSWGRRRLPVQFYVTHKGPI